MKHLHATIAVLMYLTAAYWIACQQFDRATFFAVLGVGNLLAFYRELDRRD